MMPDRKLAEQYLALACDYDGTLAHDGVVDESVIAALSRWRAAGRRLLLVTGRELVDLRGTFTRLDLFHSIVLENGGVLYSPATGDEKALAELPSPQFLDALRDRGVSPISVGQVIVATWSPHETTVLATIRDLGLELHVIFNKGAVMVLPSGVNKATGLAAALATLGISAENVVAVGDGENDHALLAAVGLGVAVANAVPSLKENAALVTRGDHGRGVTELIEQLLEDKRA
jgi:hydroxymethylpyrimidine pyrophosphatase-like HAD family hydrolase